MSWPELASGQNPARIAATFHELKANPLSGWSKTANVYGGSLLLSMKSAAKGQSSDQPCWLGQM